MLVVSCTVPSLDVAQAISRILVMEKLCACVNQVPSISSYYMYEGEFCEDEELLLLIKTSEEKYIALEKRLKELHPYDVPEIIASAITHSSSEYLSWMQEVLK
ncbi:divalent-cation tolerance protein CutA [Sulfurimonas sp. MAG313]|nr:divalent-cation tolerance protein CutA [Sulfurimonas sp. MAG313]MDF1881964.1 divalent-cation tolerance protein CutA [Sulfurimonas sp. MAG313]